MQPFAVNADLRIEADDRVKRRERRAVDLSSSAQANNRNFGSDWAGLPFVPI